MGGFLTGRTSLTTVQTADIADDAVTEAKMATDAIGITELKAGTDGEVISWDASGNPVAIGAGTSGHFLKSQGAGSVPVFAADNKGGLTFINTTDISDAATYDFTAFDASSFDGYGLFLQNIIPVTDDVKFSVRTSSDGGSSFDSGSSDYGFLAENWGAYTVPSGYTNASIEILGTTATSDYRVGSAANEPGISGWLWLYGPHLTQYTLMHWNGSLVAASGAIVQTETTGIRWSAADVDAIQYYFSSGNIESGTVTVYGLANA